MKKTQIFAVLVVVVLLFFAGSEPQSPARLSNFYEPPANTSADEGGWHYTINSDSLNERYEYPISKSSDTFRIVTLGSSWAFGHLVDTKDNYSELLEDKLNESFTCLGFRKFEVINLSVYGYDVQYMVERFRRRGVKYAPDLLIILVKDDDIMKPLELIKDTLDERTLETGQKPQFESSGQFVDELRDFRKETIKKIHDRLGEGGVLKYQTEALQELMNLQSQDLLFLFYSITPEEKSLIERLAEERDNIYFYEKGPLSEEEKNYYGSPNEEGHRSFETEIFDFISSELCT